MEIKWIKIVTDIFDDEKILLIESMPETDAIIVIWFKLLCLSGKCNNSGVLMLNERIAYTDEMLASIFRRPLNIVRLALKTFEQFGMIEVIEGAITIPNWGKHQNVDQIEKKNEYMRKYMQEYRSKQKMLAECKTNSKANVSCTDIYSPSLSNSISSKEIDRGCGGKEEKPTTDVFASYSFSDPMKAKLTEWLSYKKERKESYKPTGLTAFLSGVKNRLEKHEEADIIALIDDCMANNWKGIIWDKLPPPKPKVHIMPKQNTEPQTLEEIFGVEYD